MLEVEEKFYDEHLSSFLKTNKERFVLIKNNDYEFFDTDDDALEHGIKIYGHTVDFLVRQILEEQPVIFMPVCRSV